MAVAVACLCGGSAVTWAQPVSDDPLLEELRQRTPAGANDDKIVDDWVSGRLAGVKSGGAAAVSEFLQQLKTVGEAAGTTPAFREKSAERLGLLAKSEFDKNPAEPGDTARALVQALLAANDPRTAPGLAAALTSKDASIRYYGAKGLQLLRARLETNPNELRAALEALRKAGEQESNGVVADRIYRAMSFSNAPAEAVEAIAAVLEARLRLYRQGLPFDTYAETTACEFLGTVSLTQPQATRVLKLLAVLLRLDVERYAVPAIPPGERETLEVRIDVCEALIARLCACQGGEVRVKMEGGGAASTSEMRLELLEWIGSPQAEGVLNAAPWSVPVGAP